MKKKFILSLLLVCTVFITTGCETESAPIKSDIYPEFIQIEESQLYEKGDVYTPLKDVIVFDAADGDITAQVTVAGTNPMGLNDLNEITNAGSFVVSYVATNSAGNTTQKNVTVTVTIVYDDSDLDYELVWFDEFDYTGLPDSTKWLFEEGGSGWGNGESQYYTANDLDNASVANGVLTITAIKEDYASNEYTSARLNSTGEGDWTYGKFEIKAKLPVGTGVWPAIWMLPTDWIYGGWPESGEIDIMEYVGYDVNRVYYTIHTEAYNHSIGTQIGANALYEDVGNVYHEYQLEWLPDVLIWSIDDVEVFRYSVPAGAPINSSTWPFDTDFHLMLNIAVGGSWGGAQGIDTDIWPQTMDIDYVRVYQATNLD